MGKGIQALGDAINSIAGEETARQNAKLMNGMGTLQEDGSILLDNLPEEPFGHDEFVVLNHFFMRTGSRVFCIPVSHSATLGIVGVEPVSGLGTVNNDLSITMEGLSAAYSPSEYTALENVIIEPGSAVFCQPAGMNHIAVVGRR